MVKMMKKLNRKQKGFTLIELLVVIAILGVLAAIVIPNVSSFIGSGDDAAKDTELDNVQLAVVSAMADAQVGNITAVTDFGASNNPELQDAGGTGLGVYIGDYLLDNVNDLKCTYDVQSDGSIPDTGQDCS